MNPIPFHRPSIGDAEIAAVVEVLRSGWLTSGEQCRKFEEELARFVGARHAVAVNSCTAALHLALAVAGVGPRDRVLVPTFTFAATAEVVTHLGATPVLVDCERETLTLDVRAAERVADGARAIVPVHYAGQMADVDGVARLAARFGLRVVEDAAHALPAWARAADGSWRAVGTTAEQTCFSFYANKTITTGEGGMLVTDSPELAERARNLSLHGLSAGAWERFRAGGSWDYRICAAGFKYNLTDVAAALGRVQLARASQLADERARVAERYQRLLDGIDELELPTVRADRRSAWHLYVVRVRPPLERDAVLDELRRRGIAASVHWRPLHLHPLYEPRWNALELPVATREWRRCVSLPIFPGLTEAEQEHIAGALRELAGRRLAEAHG